MPHRKRHHPTVPSYSKQEKQTRYPDNMMTVRPTPKKLNAHR